MLLMVENALSVANNLKLDFDQYWIRIRETRGDISGGCCQSPREEVIEMRHFLSLEKPGCFALRSECFQTIRDESTSYKI